MPSDPIGASRTKAPAFQFYARDFIMGTAAMTLEERGAYITLLCHAWDNEGIPSAHVRIARILGLSVAEFDLLWPALEGKWTARGSVLVNRRQEAVRDDLADFHERARKGGEARAAAAARQPDGSFAPADDPAAQPADDPADAPAATQPPSQPESRSPSPPPSPSSTSTPTPEEKERGLFQFWRDSFGLNGQTKFTPERKRKIKQRLEDSTPDEILAAIEGVSKSQWHRDNGHTDISLICRDRSHVERYMALKDKPAGGQQGVINRRIQAGLEAAARTQGGQR